MMRFLIIAALFFGLVGITAAAGPPVNLTFPNPLACANLQCVVGKIIDVLFALALPGVPVMVIIGGYQILFAAGNPEKVSLGKKTILYSVIGFTIILLAKGVVLLVQDFFK